MDESPTCGDKPDNAAVERLRDLAACWLYAGGAMLPDLIDGAAEAIVAGADSPTLGVLAGADAGSVSAEIAPVVDATLAELGCAPLSWDDPEGAELSRCAREIADRTLRGEVSFGDFVDSVAEKALLLTNCPAVLDDITRLHYTREVFWYHPENQQPPEFWARWDDDARAVARRLAENS